jgi:MOSC domain-containing protein YiiM
MGAVERILVRAEPGGETHDATTVTVAPGEAMEGDRYRAGTGTFWVEGKAGQDLTLIEAEALEALASEHGIELSAEVAGRNLVTRGIDLNALVGKRFRIGSVECEGVELCEPCKSLERATQPGVIKGLLHRGGLNADILSDGVISVGDEIVAL